jgi:hypothetical protein
MRITGTPFRVRKIESASGRSDIGLYVAEIVFAWMREPEFLFEENDKAVGGSDFRVDELWDKGSLYNATVRKTRIKIRLKSTRDMGSSILPSGADRSS